MDAGRWRPRSLQALGGAAIAPRGRRADQERRGHRAGSRIRLGPEAGRVGQHRRARDTVLREPRFEDRRVRQHEGTRSRRNRFLKGYSYDGEVVHKEDAKIRGGRSGLKENALGFTFLKRSVQMWTPWVSASVAELVNAAVRDDKVGLCREWLIFLAGTGFWTKYCKDDPYIMETGGG